jgi:hypothetical protein
LFRDIKENPEGEKETWGMGREILKNVLRRGTSYLD